MGKSFHINNVIFGIWIVENMLSSYLTTLMASVAVFCLCTEKVKSLEICMYSQALGIWLAVSVPAPCFD